MLKQINLFHIRNWSDGVRYEGSTIYKESE